MSLSKEYFLEPILMFSQALGSRMINWAILAFTLLVVTVGAKELNLADGEYVFIHRFAEHPNIISIVLDAKIQNGRITLINNDKFDVFPRGVIEEGEIYWHSSSSQWIIVSSEEDKLATDVGGCSDGPYVINLEQMEFWTC